MKRTLALLLVTIAASFVLAAAGGEFERLSAEAAKKYTIATHEGSQYATKFSDWSTEPMLHAMNVCESQPFTNRYCDIIAVVAADGHIRRVLYSPSNPYVDCVRKDLRLGAVAPKPPGENCPFKSVSLMVRVRNTMETSHLSFCRPATSPNQALERTAARCTFTFQMIKTVSFAATLGLGGGRSAWSR